MYKLIVLAVVLAAASASPVNNQVLLTQGQQLTYSNGQYLNSVPLTYSSGLVGSPVAYTNGGLVQGSPLVYSTGVQQVQTSPVVYSTGQVHQSSPIVYTAGQQQVYGVQGQNVLIPTGAKVSTVNVPVEQHGYQIVYKK